MNPPIWDWLEELGKITDEPPGLTRTFLSPAHARARDLVAGWMRDGGLAVFEDQAGNLIGRLECGNPGAKTLVCGSHLDTVRNAGRFDGALGVVLGVAAATRIAAADIQLPFHLEVVGFSDEEGVRFQSTYLGSRYYCGILPEAELRFADADGITVGEAIRRHTPRHPAPPPRTLLGYIEAHIEQGPVLEAGDIPLGVVTAIAGQTRARVLVEGEAGHAGTTPMALRKDALAGAAECILEIEKSARAASDVVATVGELTIRSAASNVIPGVVDFTVDIRSSDDTARARFCRHVFSAMEQCATRRHLRLRVDFPLSAAAVQCTPRLTERLAAIVETRQKKCPRLVSGAGHDTVTFAQVTDTTMLFVRCRRGLSHHPDEFASAEDIQAAGEVLADFLSNFSA